MLLSSTAPTGNHSLPVALPGVLGQIAAATSPEVAEILARCWGGRRKFIPLDPSPGHELSRLLGDTLARRVARAVGGGEVNIPSAKSWLHHLDARRLADLGLPIPRIARRLGLTDNHARVILRGYGARPNGRPSRARLDAAPVILTGCETCCPSRAVAQAMGASEQQIFQLHFNAGAVPGTPLLPLMEHCPDCDMPLTG